MSGFLAGLLVAVLPLLAAGFWLGRRTARPTSLAGLGTPVEHATFETLHTASLATPPLRAGLTEETARKSARKLRSLLGTDALCLTDREQVLVWDGVGAHHRTEIMERLTGPLDTGRGEAFPLTCDTPDCTVRWAVVAPSPSTTGCTARSSPARPASRPSWSGPRGGRPLGLRPAGAGRPGPVPHPADRGGDPRPARPDLPALHLQLARRDRVLRAHRPRARP